MPAGFPAEPPAAAADVPYALQQNRQVATQPNRLLIPMSNEVVKRSGSTQEDCTALRKGIEMATKSMRDWLPLREIQVVVDPL